MTEEHTQDKLLNSPRGLCVRRSRQPSKLWEFHSSNALPTILCERTRQLF